MDRDFEGYFSEYASPAQSSASGQELEAVRYAAHGLTNDETADAMDMSRSHVEALLSAARVKLGAKNTPHLVAKALRLGLID